MRSCVQLFLLMMFLLEHRRYQFSPSVSPLQVCGVSTVVNDGLRLLKPGGLYLFLGMVHPHSKLNITGEQIIRKCLTIQGNYSDWPNGHWFHCFQRNTTGIHNYAPRHLDQAVAFLAKTIKKYPYEEVMGPTYDLSDLPSAMKIATEKEFSRVLIKPKQTNETDLKD